MAFAYGMRFDDDSNAITVIDEDNQSATTTGYINGEYVEFENNPNSVQTVVGTAADPWGDIDFETLCEALYTNNASAKLVVEQNQITGSAKTLHLTGNENHNLISGEKGSTTPSAYFVLYGEWVSIGVSHLYTNSTSTGFVDGTAHASMLPTTLTVVWHPLPEE